MNRKQIIALGAATLAVAALFAWGTIAGAAEVMGMVAAKGAAAIEAEDQIGASDEIVIERVVAPRAGWLVVHLEKMGMPGKRVGLVRVPKGVSDDVRVPLEGAKLTDKLIAAVHVDRGEAGEFEFDMDRMEHSPDKPFFVGGKEVAVVVAIAEGGSGEAMDGEKKDEGSGMDGSDDEESGESKKAASGGPFGVPVSEGEAMVEAVGQSLADATMVVDRAVTPADAWLVVHLNDGGKPGDRVGIARLPKGENREVVVQLDPSKDLSKGVIAAIHADRGETGRFEFDMMDKTRLPDQPYFVDGMEVAVVVEVR